MIKVNNYWLSSSQAVCRIRPTFFLSGLIPDPAGIRISGRTGRPDYLLTNYKQIHASNNHTVFINKDLEFCCCLFIYFSLKFKVKKLKWGDLSCVYNCFVLSVPQHNIFPLIWTLVLFRNQCLFLSFLRFMENK